MSWPRFSADSHGNVVVDVTVTTVAGVVHVEPAGPGRLVLEVGTDEACQIRITGPTDVLVDVLTDALAAVLVHLGAAL